jgi:hypothetical protein
MYYKKWYYERQGIKFCHGVVPVFGNLPRIKRIIEKYGLTDHPWRYLLNEEFPGKRDPIVGFFVGYQPLFEIGDPHLV